MTAERLRFMREFAEEWVPKWFREVLDEVERLRAEVERLRRLADLVTEPMPRRRPRFRGDTATRHAEEISDHIERGQE